MSINICICSFVNASECFIIMGPFNNMVYNFIPTCISNLISSKVFDEITYPYPNFKGCTAEVWEWISNLITPFPLLSYFFVVVCLKYLLHHILSLIAYTFREIRDFVFIIIAQFMMSENSRIRFGLQIAFVCLYITSSQYHHCANLFEGIELIECLSDIFCRVCD